MSKYQEIIEQIAIMFKAYKQRRTALIISGEYRNDLTESLIEDDWHITNLENFYENLSLWHPNECNGNEIVRLLFSDPIPGIKQHLANHQDLNVGISGNNVSEIEKPILFEYHRRGYDVVCVECKKLLGEVKYTKEYIPCVANMVKLTKKSLN